MTKALQASAIAPANIAFIKYWGRKDAQLRLPANDSISMNLGGIETKTSVKFSPDLQQDTLTINGEPASSKERSRVSRFLDTIRNLSEFKYFASVDSHNNFPKGTGIASSASGFAALTVAATAALGLEFSERELSQLARLGSGSACRSIPDGFVEWKTANLHQDSYAYSLFPADHWDIVDVIAIVDAKEKKYSSSQGHEAAVKSPFFAARQEYLVSQTARLKDALERKDFSTFGECLEQETINFQSVIMTSQPAIYYWNPTTMAIILFVQQLREQGLAVYFSIDAGPNVHLIVEQKNVETLKRELGKIEGIAQLMVAPPAPGARVVSN